MDLLERVTACVGLVAVVGGVSLIYAPLGLVVGGILLCALAFSPGGDK